VKDLLQQGLLYLTRQRVKCVVEGSDGVIFDPMVLFELPATYYHRSTDSQGSIDLGASFLELLKEI